MGSSGEAHPPSSSRQARSAWVRTWQSDKDEGLRREFIAEMCVATECPEVVGGSSPSVQPPNTQLGCGYGISISNGAWDLCDISLKTLEGFQPANQNRTPASLFDAAKRAELQLYRITGTMDDYLDLDKRARTYKLAEDLHALLAAKDLQALAAAEARSGAPVAAAARSGAPVAAAARSGAPVAAAARSGAPVAAEARSGAPVAAAARSGAPVAAAARSGAPVAAAARSGAPVAAEARSGAPVAAAARSGAPVAAAARSQASASQQEPARLFTSFSDKVGTFVKHANMDASGKTTALCMVVRQGKPLHFQCTNDLLQSELVKGLLLQ
jgi:hypothetical protein